MSRRRSFGPYVPPDEVQRRRIAAARERALVVLHRRIACYRRELERLVCEVGFNFVTTPHWQQPEPYHLTEAIKALVDERLVVEHDVEINGTSYRFWSHGKATPESTEAVLQRKVAAVTVFQTVEHRRRDAGWHAEAIHYRAMTAGPWLGVGYTPGRPIVALHDRRLAEDRPGDIDLAGFHGPTNLPFAAQVKNTREWFYAWNHDIWDLLGAAAQLDALPIFVARRFADSTFVFMKLVGGFALRATKLIFPAELRDSVPLPGQMSFLEALKELALHTDADFIDEPLPRHRKMWTAVAEEVSEAYERFQLVKARVLELAYDEQLARDVRHGRATGRDRRDIIDEFLQQIRARDRQTAQEAMVEPPPDPPPPSAGGADDR